MNVETGKNTWDVTPKPANGTEQAEKTPGDKMAEALAGKTTYNEFEAAIIEQTADGPFPTNDGSFYSGAALQRLLFSVYHGKSDINLVPVEGAIKANFEQVLLHVHINSASSLDDLKSRLQYLDSINVRLVGSQKEYSAAELVEVIDQYVAVGGIAVAANQLTSAHGFKDKVISLHQQQAA